jgi:hypothetical protein
MTVVALAVPPSGSAVLPASNLKVAAVTGSPASLQWTASGDAAGYRVWRGDGSRQNWELVFRAYDASGDVSSNGILAMTAAATAPPAPSPSSSSDAPLFPRTSVWNRPIPPSPVLDAKSSTWIGSLSAGRHPADLYEFGIPIYETTAGTPRYTVRTLNAPAWGPDSFADVMIPLVPSYTPASGSDRAMAVIDRSARKVYGFWRYRWNGGRPYTSWGGVASLDGPGNGDGSTGAGVSRAAGVVRAKEIAVGVVNHALVFSTDIGNCSGRFRHPASKTDGGSTASTCIPEGARVQLDPSVNLDAIIGMPEGEKIVGRALQKYGAIDIDNGGARMAFVFERPSDEADPYPSVGLARDYFNMSHIPWKRLRVLRGSDGR